MQWIWFHLFIFTFLGLDLFLFKHEEVKFKKALLWSLGWIGLALLFNVYIFWSQGHERGLEFFTAYLIEKSLSLDNLFIFLVVFSYFKIPKASQHDVLYFGVIGAIVFRIILILVGISLIGLFNWFTYLLGVVVAYTGFRLILKRDEVANMNESRLVRFMRSRFNLTPFLLALITIETTDIVFALDSIPAVLVVTKDPFIAYTSNIFAILGLRSLFFLIAPWFDILAKLKVGLGAVLIFIGLKMVLSPFIHIPLSISLAVIATILLISVLYSLLKIRN